MSASVVAYSVIGIPLNKLLNFEILVDRWEIHDERTGLPTGKFKENKSVLIKYSDGSFYNSYVEDSTFKSHQYDIDEFLAEIELANKDLIIFAPCDCFNFDIFKNIEILSHIIVGIKVYDNYDKNTIHVGEFSYNENSLEILNSKFEQAKTILKEQFKYTGDIKLYNASYLSC